MIWQDWNGRGGVQFVDVPKTSRRLLTEYLGANRSSDVREELPDVTVDVEDPMIVTAAVRPRLSMGFRRKDRKDKDPRKSLLQNRSLSWKLRILTIGGRRNAMPAAWAQKCIGRERRSPRIAV